MDATRARRTKDLIRTRWYAYWRTVRFADRMGSCHFTSRKRFTKVSD